MTAHQAIVREYPDATAIGGKLYSIEAGPSSVTMAKILRVLFPDVTTVLDMTWGDGGFWDRSVLNTLQVFGNDINTDKGCVFHEDFTGLPALSNGYDLVVFDPPYQTDAGKVKGSRMSDKYGHYPTLAELETAVQAGCEEAWRIARIGMVVKVQDYIHGGKYVEMTEWVRAVMDGPPYQIVHQVRAGKQEDPKWTDEDGNGQLSAYAIHSTYMVYRKGSQTHRARKPSTSRVVATAEAPSRKSGRVMGVPV